MSDRYTKMILTVIAVCLVWICVRDVSFLTPTQAQTEKAIAIVRAAREAERLGFGAVAVGSKMVDPPVVKQAFRTVELGIAGGVLGADWDEVER